jgi:phosphoglycerate dehydrogenase-like enzyme
VFYHAAVIIALSPLVAGRYGERIRAIAPAGELVWPKDGAWSGAGAQRTEVAYFSEDFWTSGTPAQRAALFTLPDVRWFHSFSAGVDHPAFRALLERGAVLTNSAGTSSVPIAQYVLGMMLRIVKRMDDWSAAQRDRRWEPVEAGELTGMTAGVVGLGQIGSEVARLAKAFRMRVIGCRRSAKRSRFVDEQLPPERLHELFRAADFVVLALPLSSQTERLFGERELAAMGRDAWLINVSRGRVIDEAALIRALDAQRIGGAVLDVFEEEPLPANSTLWSRPNVIVTPHNSGRSPQNFGRGTELFLDNLARYVAGRPLRNRVRLQDL